MTIIILILASLLILYLNFRSLPINWHGNIPQDLKFDQECIEVGVIPHRLSWVIPRDYIACEGYSVSSHIESTFVSETHDPKWALVIRLSNPKETQEAFVMYNLDGSLYEY